MKKLMLFCCLLLVGCVASQQAGNQSRDQQLEKLLIGEWKYSALRVDGVLQLNLTEGLKSLSKFAIISFGSSGEFDVLNFKKASILKYTLGDDFVVTKARYEVRKGWNSTLLVFLMQTSDKNVTTTRELELEFSKQQLVLTAPKTFIDGELVDTDQYRENMEYVYTRL